MIGDDLVVKVTVPSYAPKIALAWVAVAKFCLKMAFLSIRWSLKVGT